ncbi:patatin-like phospholipase family protein [Thioalkalivibrio versutus]|uniref:patatin-like phospholipase family protein n=1 Tax=Thioalkalivibrio versutus TaxID=106634 RepID=UPI000369E502|nr:patatin-like phospholipase family protein [Thioalkalivibrio versutus]OOC49157.1 serine protease [Thioalkalivibrio versutus]
MTRKPQSISLVLGSGGARGLAQIGVIRWLEEHSDYRIRSIAGASMGAVVGGIYAAGQLDAYEAWVKSLRRQDVWRLLDFSFRGAGLIRGDRLIEKLRDMLGDMDIEDLPISFTAVATDIEREREVWLNSGSLFDAIRASIAIPTVFTPVRHKGRLLVDGGLLNPVPIAPTLTDDTDITLAVSLNGRVGEELIRPERAKAPDPDREEPDSGFLNHRLTDALPDRVGSWLLDWQDKLGLGETDPGLSREQEAHALGMIDIVSHSIEAMQGTIARFRIAAYNPEHLIEVPVNACGIFDFHRAAEMIDLGYELADHKLGRR